MAEEPQFPSIPAIGEILDRKKKFVERKHSVLKCKACQESYSRLFKPGDFVFKELTDEECEKCHRSSSLSIVEIYSEWVNPKKKIK
jgi:Zn finger protein HypA/HybF involved in hydrogenase expression